MFVWIWLHVCMFVRSTHHFKKFANRILCSYENMINYLLNWSTRPELAQQHTPASFQIFYLCTILWYEMLSQWKIRLVETRSHTYTHTHLTKNIQHLVLSLLWLSMLTSFRSTSSSIYLHFSLFIHSFTLEWTGWERAEVKLSLSNAIRKLIFNVIQFQNAFMRFYFNSCFFIDSHFNFVL